MGESVTSIGSWAFSSCSSLESVTIVESVTSLGRGVFYNCSSLTSIVFEDTSEWYYTFYSDYSDGHIISFETPTTNATSLKGYSYNSHYFYKL